MLEKVLVANRGEIALRVIRACRDLGIASVAVYSDPDRDLRFVHEADEAVWIGPAPARQSYLAIDKLMDAARSTGADSLHPGYGFLSENPELARAVAGAGLVFVGPPADVIEALGSKLETRRIMAEAGVPVLPGTAALTEKDDVAALAEAIGYPLLVKPSGGGGGRGMRLVEDPADLHDAVDISRREAEGSFKDSSVYLERLLTAGRHVEVQVIADAHGNVVHVGDRDCSMQRRHQKVVEESPAPHLTAEQHQHVCALAVAAVRAAGYVNAGTVEFLYDCEDEFYVLEVNTRIQVEHCVSEAVTGIDLVAEQLLVAGGAPLSFAQQDVEIRGHAIECRVYAENPERGFAPSTGTILSARFPAGPWIREDRGFEVGDAITPYYDGMLAKLIAWGPDRDTAIARALRALREYRIEGLSTNTRLLRWLIDCDAFRSVQFDTRFIEREFRAELLPAPAPALPAPPAPQPVLPSQSRRRRANRVEVFHYHRDSNGVDQSYLIHAVDRGDSFEAVPLSPGDGGWADSKYRRAAPTAELAVDGLIDQVLDMESPDQIFDDLRVSF